MRLATSLVLLAAVAAAALEGLGCANHVSQTAAPVLLPPSGEAASRSPVSLQSTVASSHDQIDRTLQSLRLLVAAQDPRPAYEAFAVEVDRLRWSAMQCQRDAQASERHSVDYLGEWEILQAGTMNDDLRRVNEQRRDDVMSSFERLRVSHDASREAFLPLTQEFEAIRQDLAPNPSAAAVAQVVPAARLGAVTEKAANLKLSLDAVETDRLALTNALARTQRADLSRQPSTSTQTQ
jgi:hypothetical protein